MHRYIHHTWVWFKQIPYSVFLCLFIISSLTCIFALRGNNETMIILRNQLYTADKNNGDVNGSLNKLRQYVYSHMNTDLSSGGNSIKPPIQLEYTYQRLESAAQSSANNNSLYTEAENYCQAQIPASVSISGSGRISCVQNYIMSHGGKAAASIPPAIYEFDFVSPTWSPDLAGWSMVASVLFLAIFAVKFLAARF